MRNSVLLDKVLSLTAFLSMMATEINAQSLLAAVAFIFQVVPILILLKTE